MNKLFSDTLKMSFVANQVIGLRLMKIATGGAHGKRESDLMVSEKLEAAAEAGLAAATSMATDNRIAPPNARSPFTRSGSMAI